MPTSVQNDSMRGKYNQPIGKRLFMVCLKLQFLSPILCNYKVILEIKGRKI